MRRETLRPPRQVPLASTPAFERRAAAIPRRDRLGRPQIARAKRRALFHPKRGWFRRFERAVSHFLSRRLYPRIPGIELPYDWLLARQLTLSERVRFVKTASGSWSNISKTERA